MAFSVVSKCGDAQNSSPGAGDQFGLVQKKGCSATNANHHTESGCRVKTRTGQFE
jgi:hypothetical protein